MSLSLDVLLAFFELSSPWELAASSLALVYVILAVRRSLWCWLFALVSSAIYVAVMWRAQLYMQAALQVFYVAMAVYGFAEWRRGRDPHGEMSVIRWPLKAHVLATSAVVLTSLINGTVLPIYLKEAALPFVDAVTAWGSVLATVLVARRVAENWLYWIVIDTVSAYLFFRRGLNATALLFVVYTALAVHGYYLWIRHSRRTDEQKNPS